MWKTKMRRLVGVPLLLIPALILSACGGKTAGQSELLLYEGNGEEDSAVSSSAVSGSAVGTDDVKFDTTVVRKTAYKEEINCTAELEYLDTETLIIDDEDAVLDSVKVKKYQKVKKGDVLAVYHVETSKTKLEKQKLMIDQARADYEVGLSNLNQQLSQAQKALSTLASKAEKKIRQLEVKKIQKQISAYKKGEKEITDQERDYAELLKKQKKTPLRAKRDGVITETEGRGYVGEDIDASTEIVKMHGNNGKWILIVGGSEAADFRYNMDVSVRLGKSAKEYDHEVKGKVISSGDITGQQSQNEEGDSVIYIDVSDKDKKKYDFENSNIYIYAVSFMVKDALVVDAEAVQQESVDIRNRLFVYVVENGKLHKRFIVSNYKNDKEVLVEQGVFEGQTLAILD